MITYIILPDEKTTYHPIGALLLKQIYEKLVEIAIRKGGELDRRFIFRTEEIGNFPKIPDLGTMLSAGAGRNIFFELVIQDYQQLEHKYKEEWREYPDKLSADSCVKSNRSIHSIRVKQAAWKLYGADERCISECERWSNRQLFCRNFLIIGRDVH